MRFVSKNALEYVTSRLKSNNFFGEEEEDPLSIPHLGPATYVVNAADLQPIHPGNELVKYADDTYLLSITTPVKKRCTMSKTGQIKIIYD